MAAIGFLVLLCIPCGGDESDEQKIFDRFIAYTNDVYMLNVEKSLKKDIRVGIYPGHQKHLVYGYSLGNLLQYARRGSENHKIWLMLERKTKKMIFEEFEKEGALRGLDRASIEKRKQEAWKACIGALQGWSDAEMMMWTKVDPRNAPDFFESMSKYDSADDNPDKKVFRDLVASDILVKEQEIGSGFFLYRDMGRKDHRAEAEFRSKDKKIAINVTIFKMNNLETYQKHHKNYQLYIQKYALKSNYEAERLSLGQTTYIYQIGKASYDAESYPGQLWYLWVRGKYYYSGSEEGEKNAPKVKTAVTNAITAMYNRVIKSEGR